MSRTPPRGVALPAVVLLLLALTALGQAALAVAQGSRQVALARAARARAALLAEGAARIAASELAPRAGAKTAEPGATGWLDGLSPAPGLASRVRVHRLDPEWHLLEVEATAVSPAGVARERVLRVAWFLDPAARVRWIRGVVEHGGPLRIGSDAALDPSGFDDPPSGWSEAACSPYRDLRDSVGRPVRLRPAWRLRGSGDPGPARTRSEDPWATVPGLGVLSASDLAGLARSVDAPATRSAEEGAGCGAPPAADPGTFPGRSRPCGNPFRLVAAPGDLALEGEEGAGILLVGGDLVLGAGAEFRGVLLVGGSLRATGGARIEGWVRVRGGVRLDGGAVVRGSGCLAGTALERALARRSPVFPAGGSWLAWF